MKKFFASAFVALALFAFVACESNPAIKAAKKYIKNPTVENAEKVEAAAEGLSEKEAEEFLKWCIEHADEIEAADAKL
jgi:uncharacterized protein YcfL